MTKAHTKKASTVDPRVVELRKIYAEGVAYIEQYFFFADPNMAKIVTLWAMATWFLKSFDTFGYLAIWARLPRCGKTALGQAVAYMSRNYNLSTDVTPAALFAMIDAAGEDGKTLCVDECERYNNEGHPLREVLNVGCYRGIGVPRTKVIHDEEVGSKRIAEDFEVFGGKIFICIGNVFNTLRDRSIQIEMSRKPSNTPLKRYLMMIARPEGEAIGKQMNAASIQSLQSETQEGGNLVRATMMRVMLDTEEMDSRQLEMWSPVLTMATLMELPELLKELFKSADALKFEATQAKVSAREVELMDKDQKVADFAEDMLEDLGLAVLKSKKNIRPEDLVSVITTQNPLWLKFMGGLTHEHVTKILSIHGIQSKVTRDSEKKTKRTKQENGKFDTNNKAVARVYRADDIVTAYNRMKKQQNNNAELRRKL